jgi:Zn-dependent M28 family amino/carboxypeptidase
LVLPSSAFAQQTDVDPRITALVASISEQRLTTLLQKLASYETRNTMSNPDQAGRGIGAARQWIFDEMRRSSPRLEVSFDTYQVAAQGDRILEPVELRNVIAVLPGRSARRVYVSGHYDTVARINNRFDYSVGDNPAPGANDDGSGTVLTMELARVFAESGLTFDATLVFAAFAGEEQGLVGAHLHAEKALGEGTIIDAVFNNDIVGGAVGGAGVADAETVRVFSEGPEDSPSRQLARHIRKSASRYVPDHRVALVARYDRFGRGGDHIAFNQRGFTAVRITEANENYEKQHSVNDTLDGVSFSYLAQNARVNAAAVASLALAPPSPVVVNDRGAPMLTRDPSGYDARLQWKSSPGAASYRVYWRAAWSNDWDTGVAVGNVTEYQLPRVSIDDFVFGVTAIGADGNESLVAAYVNPPRVNLTVKTLP